MLQEQWKKIQMFREVAYDMSNTFPIEKSYSNWTLQKVPP